MITALIMRMVSGIPDSLCLSMWLTNKHEWQGARSLVLQLDAGVVRMILKNCLKT